MGELVLLHPKPGEAKRGDRVVRLAACIGYKARHHCGWSGALVREVGSETIPPCPQCGGWTVATRERV